MSAPPAARRSLVLIGGGLDDSNIATFTRIVQLAGGPGLARIGIITASSSVPPPEHMADYSPPFLLAGAADLVWIPIDRDHLQNASDPSTLELVASCTGFFFTGGDQSYLKAAFMPQGIDTPALALIRRKWREGCVLAGTSAGEVIHQGAPMVEGGESFEGLLYGPFLHEAPNLPYALLHDPQGGFGFFPHAVIESHADYRGRVGRNFALMKANGRKLGFGVDEDTALIVLMNPDDSCHLSVLGKGGVAIYDLHCATWEEEKDPIIEEGKPPARGFHAKGIKFSYLTRGDECELTADGKYLCIVAEWKSSLSGREDQQPLPPLTDIFSSESNGDGGRKRAREFILVAQQLAHCALKETHGLSFEEKPRRIRVDFKGGQGFTGKGVEASSEQTSVLNMELSVYTL